jgi:hypothetical protein
MATSLSPVLAPLLSKLRPTSHEPARSRDIQMVGGAPVLALAASMSAVPSTPMAIPGSAEDDPAGACRVTTCQRSGHVAAGAACAPVAAAPLATAAASAARRTPSIRARLPDPPRALCAAPGMGIDWVLRFD